MRPRSPRCFAACASFRLLAIGNRKSAIENLMPPILLVNPNLMRPPVTPVALDHIGQHLRAADLQFRQIDPMPLG